MPADVTCWTAPGRLRDVVMDAHAHGLEVQAVLPAKTLVGA